MYVLHGIINQSQTFVKFLQVKWGAKLHRANVPVPGPVRKQQPSP